MTLLLDFGLKHLVNKQTGLKLYRSIVNKQKRNYQRKQYIIFDAKLPFYLFISIAINSATFSLNFVDLNGVPLMLVFSYYSSQSLLMHLIVLNLDTLSLKQSFILV